MLDFVKLSKQITALTKESLALDQENVTAPSDALQALLRAMAEPEQFAALLEESREEVMWPLLRPLSLATGTSCCPQAASEPWTAMGVDGSQIMPSHHEVHNCYLLNAGLAQVSYGRNQSGPFAPRLLCEPSLFARPDNLYPLIDRRRIHIDELYVSLERNLFELRQLLALAESFRCAATEFRASLNVPNAADEKPITDPTTKSTLSSNGRNEALPDDFVVAFFDGSLIPWSVEKMPESYQEEYIAQYQALLSAFRELQVPILGYISRSRACDLVNALRVFICPYAQRHCREHCGSLKEEDFPCSKIWPLTDRVLLDKLLENYQYFGGFGSGASVLRHFSAANRIAFTYWKHPQEVARLEFPQWVWDEHFPDLLNGVHGQVLKGQGYPLVLGEAHHLAVVRGTEREAFYQLLGQHMQNIGLQQVKVSAKASTKLKSFV